MFSFFLVLLSIYALVTAANTFVDQAAALAKKFRVSDYLIGFTVVAFGTSLPELVSALFSASAGHNHLVVSSIIGSNLVNTALILGLVALLYTIQIRARDVTTNLPMNLAAIAGFWAISVFTGFAITWPAGIALITIFLGLLSLSKSQDNTNAIKKRYAKLSYATLSAALVLLILAGKLCVDQIVSLATQLKVSETFLGYFLLAIGTSLPELITTWVAVKKRNGELGIGSILGSNLFNLLFIFGISTFIQPLQISGFTTELVFLTVAALLTYFFAVSGKKYSLNRWEGFGLVCFYAVFIAYQAFKF